MTTTPHPAPAEKLTANLDEAVRRMTELAERANPSVVAKAGRPA
jgi:hypothetical protein